MDNPILWIFVVIVVVIAILGASQTGQMTAACEAKGGTLLQSTTGVACVTGVVPL